MAAALQQYQACLGIMVRLELEDLNLLKEDFDRMGRGLSLHEFVSAMLDRVSWEVENVVPFIEDLVELFAQVDVNGDGAMEWEEFTSAIIEGGMGTSSEEAEWRDLKYEESARFVDLGNRPPKRVQIMHDFRRLLLYENTRPVVEIIDPTTLFTSDADGSVASRGGGGSSANTGSDGSEDNTTPRGASDSLFTPTVSIVNHFHPLCYTPGYRRDQDEVRSERSPVQAIKYLSVVELLAVSAGDLKLTFWATTILTATSASALETPVPLAVVHTPRPQRVLEWNAATQHLYSISADLVISVWLVEREKKHDSKGRCEVTLVSTLKKHTDLLQDLLVLNAETLVTCGMDSMIYLWDALTLKPKAVRQGHRRGVRLLTKLSSQLFISAGFECEVLGWDISALATTPVFKLWGHTSPVCCLQLITSTAFASQIERLANAAPSSASAATAAATAQLADQAITVDDDGWFKWWNLADVLAAESSELEKSNSRCLQTFRLGADKYPWKAHSLAVLNNGQTILAAGMHKLKLLTRVRLKPKVLESSVVLFNSVSCTLLTTTDKELRIWDAASGALIRTYSGVATADITCVDLDARQRKIVFGTQSGELVVLNYLNGAVLKHWTPHQLHVAALVYCKEDQCVLTASWDRSLRLYDDNASANALLRCVTDAHDADIKCLAYCYALSLVASGSTDGAIKIWDYIYFLLEDSCCVVSDGGPHGRSSTTASHTTVHADVNALEFVEPYPLLLSAHENGMVCVWALASMHKATTLLVCFHPMAASPLTSIPLTPKGSDAEESARAKSEGISCCQVLYDEEGGEVMANDIRRGRFLLLSGGHHGALCVSDISQVIAKSGVRAFREESLPSSHLRSYNPRRRFLRQGKTAKRLRGKHGATTSSNGHDDGAGSGASTSFQSAVHIDAAVDIQRVAWWRAHEGNIRCLRTVEEPRAILTCGSDKSVKVWAFDGACLGVLGRSGAGGGGSSGATATDSSTAESSAWRWEMDVETTARAKREQAEAIWNDMKASKLKSMLARHQSVVELRRKRRKPTAVELGTSMSAPSLGISATARPETAVAMSTDASGEALQEAHSSEASRLFEQLHGKATWKQSDVQVARQAAWEHERSKFQQRMKKIMRAKEAGNSRQHASGLRRSSTSSLPGNQEHAGEAGLGELMEEAADDEQADDANVLPAFDKSVQELPYHDKDNWSVGSLNREKQMYSNLHHENVRRSQVAMATTAGGVGSTSRVPRYPRSGSGQIDLAPSSFLLEKLGASCVVIENLPPQTKTKAKAAVPSQRKRLGRSSHTQSAPALSTTATASIQQLRNKTTLSSVADGYSDSGVSLAPHHSMQELIRQYDRLMQDPQMEDEEEQVRRSTKLFAAMPNNIPRRGSYNLEQQQQQRQQRTPDPQPTNQNEVSQQRAVKKVSSAPSSRQQPRSPSNRPISSAKPKPKMQSEEAKKPEVETTAAKKLRMRSEAALLRQDRFGPHSRDDVVNIYRTFQKLDKDQSGTITLRELRDGAGLFSGSDLQDNIMSIFSSIDKDQSGHIDLQELLTAIFGGNADQASVLPDIFRFCHLLECAEKAKKAKKRQLSPDQLKELYALFKVGSRSCVRWLSPRVC